MSNRARRALKHLPRLLSRKPRWPDPELSVGEYLLRIDSRNMCWDAVGRAREVSIPLSKEIRDFLNKAGDVAPCTEYVSFSVYMIGKSKQKAAPYVMFFSENAQARREIQQAIKESGILKRYPGIQSGNAARDPGLSQPAQLLSPVSFNPSRAAMSATRDPSPSLRTQLQPLSLESISNEVMQPDNLIRLEFSHSFVGDKVISTCQQGDTTSAHTTTLGGIISHGDSSYVLTAGHPFNASCPPHSPDVQRTTSESWEIDTSTASDHGTILSCDCILSEINPSTSLKLEARGSTQATPAVVEEQTNPETSSLLPIESVCGQLTTLSPDLDYALIKIQGSMPSFAMKDCDNRHESTKWRTLQIVSPCGQDKHIVACTASRGLLTGILSGSPTNVRLPNSKTFQEVFTVHFQGHLARGDCGSWVTNPERQGLYGHIIAGCEETGVAYIMPAQNVLEDVRERLGFTVNLHCRIPDATGLAQHDVSEEKMSGNLDQMTCSNIQISMRNLSGIGDPPFDQEVGSSSPIAQHVFSGWMEPSDRWVDFGYWDSSDLESSPVRDFMFDCNLPNACQPTMDKVVSVCGMANLGDLYHKKLESVAWCHTWFWGDGVQRRESSQGPFTAFNLFQILNTPLHEVGHKILGRAVRAGADRSLRKIFITDLDCWSILALVGTVPRNQAFVLRNMLYKHLSFDVSIMESQNWTGVHTEQLAFHLPYYALRASTEVLQDHRRDIHGTPLRHTQDVSFLDTMGCIPSLFLCEAQISCAVATRKSQSTVYFFLDTYFDTTEDKETVTMYCEDGEEGLNADPLTRGQHFADKPILDPREYFFVILSSRLTQVKSEWQMIVHKLSESICWYEQNLLQRIPKRSTEREIDAEDNELKRSISWIEKVKPLSQKLSGELSKTITAWERFRDHDLRGSQNNMESNFDRQSLWELQMLFREMYSMKDILDSLATRCDGFAQHLQLNLSSTVMLIENRQRQLVNEHKNMSAAMIFFMSPIALTAGIFSMEPTVIPFPSSPGSFTALLLIFSLVVALITIFSPQALICRFLYDSPTWAKVTRAIRTGRIPRNLSTIKRSPYKRDVESAGGADTGSVHWDASSSREAWQLG